MFKILVATLMTFLVSNAFAGLGGCSGKHKGKTIVINGRGHIANKSNATGSIVIEGRRLAVFDGEDLKINYLTRSFRITNSQGDQLQGRLNNMKTLTGTMSRITIRAYGIDYRNVPMRCWMNN